MSRLPTDREKRQGTDFNSYATGQTVSPEQSVAIGMSLLRRVALNVHGMACDLRAQIASLEEERGHLLRQLAEKQSVLAQMKFDQKQMEEDERRLNLLDPQPF